MLLQAACISDVPQHCHPARFTHAQVLLRSDAAPQVGYATAGLLHAGSGYWEPEQPLPVPALADHAVVAVGNSLFILGGSIPSNQVGGWSTSGVIASACRALCKARCMWVGRKGLQLGPPCPPPPHLPAFPPPHVQTVSAAVWEFDTLLSTYTDLPAPRTRAGAAALGGKLYVVGGYSSLEESEGPQGMLVYDIEAGTWNASGAWVCLCLGVRAVSDLQQQVCKMPCRRPCWERLGRLIRGAPPPPPSPPCAPRGAAAELNVPRSDACMAAVGGLLYIGGGAPSCQNCWGPAGPSGRRCAPHCWL